MKKNNNEKEKLRTKVMIIMDKQAENFSVKKNKESKKD